MKKAAPLPMRLFLSDSAYFSHSLFGRPFAFVRLIIQILPDALQFAYMRSWRERGEFLRAPHFKASHVAVETPLLRR